MKNMKFEYVFLDEVSMLQERFYKFLLMIKKLKPNTKFIISGHYKQIPPVNDRVSSDFDYEDNTALFELSDFKKVELTKCCRASDTLFDLVKFENVPNLAPEQFNNTSDVTACDMHLCYTNKKRIEINNVMMTHKRKGYKGPSIKLDRLKWDEHGQDVILQVDTPIMSKINNNEIGIVNNKRFKITAIAGSNITIKNDYKTISFDAIDSNTFQRYFRVAYCSTIHCQQGATIGEHYMIHQWED